MPAGRHGDRHGFRSAAAEGRTHPEDVLGGRVPVGPLDDQVGRSGRRTDPGQRADHPAYVQPGRGEQAAVGEQAARVEAVVRQFAADQHPAVRQVPRGAGHRLHPAGVGQFGVHLGLAGTRVDRQHQAVLLHPAQHGDQRAAAVRPAHVHHVRIGLPVPVHVDPAAVQVEQVQAGRAGRAGGQHLPSVRRPPPAAVAPEPASPPGRAPPTRSGRRARARRCPGSPASSRSPSGPVTRSADEPPARVT